MGAVKGRNNWLMMFKKITAVYSEKHTKPTNVADR
jgi:hypothetical protein